MMQINFDKGTTISKLQDTLNKIKNTPEKLAQSNVLFKAPVICPVKIKWKEEADFWTFPIEPEVAISSKNIITKRNVLKMDNTKGVRGTVKEFWTQGDYEVSISGILIGKNGELPQDEIDRLRAYCEASKVVELQSDIFTFFNIKCLAIESYNFPFTKGKESQTFSIKGYSDDDFELLVKEGEL